MDISNFGKMIYKLRKKHNLTQNELAKLLNVSDKAVSKWENNAGYPEITLLAKLSEIFSVPIDHLLKSNPSGIAVAGYYAFPVLDLYRVSGMQPSFEVIKEKFMPDGLHPNDDGSKRIAERVLGFLRSL